MTGGAIAVILFGEISPAGALHAINPEVILFLFGMFTIGQAAIQSGLLSLFSNRFCRMTTGADQRIAYIILFAAVSSAVFMNDTIAVIGTPLVMTIAQRSNISAKKCLLALCFAITTGSILSPIGNPQNFLIVVYSSMKNPFTSFFGSLLIPTVISLLLILIVMKIAMRRRCGEDDSVQSVVDQGIQPDTGLCRITGISLIILVGILLMRSLGGLWDLFSPLAEIPLVAAPVVASVFILLLSPGRMVIFKKIDWCTLLFFVSMFVLMQSVYMTGYFQSCIPVTLSVPGLLAISIVISQFISNVPFVALFQPMLTANGMSQGMVLALAAGSTLAGNLTILGAASNVIVVEQAERRGVSLSFWDFCSVGIPLTILQAIVYAVFLSSRLAG